MAYFILEIKKVLKNMLTWLILGLFFCLTSLILWHNAVVSNQHSTRRQIESSLVDFRKEISKQEVVLKDGKKNSSKKQEAKSYLAWLHNHVEVNQTILAAIDRENWQEAYRLLIKVDQEDSEAVNAEMRPVLALKIARHRALQHEHLSPEDEKNPTSGLLFFFQMLASYLPILYTLALSFILSTLYTGKYTAGMNKARLLPEGKIVGNDLLQGLIIAGGLYLIFMAFILLPSSLFFHLGSLAYPVLVFVLPSGAPRYVSLESCLGPTLIITALTVIFSVLTILLLAQITRNQLATLFSSLVILMGGAILPIIFQQIIGKVAHLLPTTYLLSQQVITGDLNNRFSELNPQLNFATGCRVLVIAIAVLLILNILWSKLTDRIFFGQIE